MDGQKQEKNYIPYLQTCKFEKNALNTANDILRETSMYYRMQTLSKPSNCCNKHSVRVRMNIVESPEAMNDWMRWMGRTNRSWKSQEIFWKWCLRFLYILLFPFSVFRKEKSRIPKMYDGQGEVSLAAKRRHLKLQALRPQRFLDHICANKHHHLSDRLLSALPLPPPR